MKYYKKMLYGPFAEKGLRDIDGEERVVGGYFTDDKVDMYGHMIDRSAMVRAVADYAGWGNIREMHARPVGVAKSVGEKEWNYIEAKIIPDDTWKLVESGVYKGFSVGIIVTDGEFVSVEDIPEDKFDGVPSSVRKAIEDYGEVFRITGLELVEVSIVDRPANPRAVIGTKGVDAGDGVLPSVVEGGALLHKAFSAKDIVEDGKVEEEAKVAEVDSAEVELEAETEQEAVAESVEEKEITEEVEVEEKDVEVEVDDGPSIADIHERIVRIESALDAIMEFVSGGDEEEVVDYEKIANLVVEKMLERKGTVNGVQEEQEEKTLDVKSLDRGSLARLIAIAAAQRL